MEILKKAVAALLLVGFSLSCTSSAEDKKDDGYTVPIKTLCGAIPYVTQLMMKDYGELPVVVGKWNDSTKSQIVIFYNKHTETFTILEYRYVNVPVGVDGKKFEEVQLACVLGSGQTKFDMRALIDIRS